MKTREVQKKICLVLLLILVCVGLFGTCLFANRNVLTIKAETIAPSRNLEKDSMDTEQLQEEFFFEELKEIDDFPNKLNSNDDSLYNPYNPYNWQPGDPADIPILRNLSEPLNPSNNGVWTYQDAYSFALGDMTMPNSSWPDPFNKQSSIENPYWLQTWPGMIRNVKLEQTYASKETLTLQQKRNQLDKLANLVKDDLTYLGKTITGGYLMKSDEDYDYMRIKFGGDNHIAIRIYGSRDYHFMRFQSDWGEWRHKPSINSVILRHGRDEFFAHDRLHTTITWVNEEWKQNNGSLERIGSTFLYPSEIYIISYSDTKWQTNTSDGTTSITGANTQLYDTVSIPQKIIEQNIVINNHVQGIPGPLITGITNIGSHVYLKEIHIPATITSINSGVFNNCPNLEKIVVAPGNKGGYYSYNGVLYRQMHGQPEELVFYPPKSDAKLDFPEQVNSIINNAHSIIDQNGVTVAGSNSTNSNNPRLLLKTTASGLLSFRWNNSDKGYDISVRIRSNGAQNWTSIPNSNATTTQRLLSVEYNDVGNHEIEVRYRGFWRIYYFRVVDTSDMPRSPFSIDLSALGHLGLLYNARTVGESGGVNKNVHMVMFSDTPLLFPIGNNYKNGSNDGWFCYDEGVTNHYYKNNEGWGFGVEIQGKNKSNQNRTYISYGGDGDFGRTLEPGEYQVRLFRVGKIQIYKSANPLADDDEGCKLNFSSDPNDKTIYYLRGLSDYFAGDTGYLTVLDTAENEVLEVKRADGTIEEGLLLKKFQLSSDNYGFFGPRSIQWNPIFSVKINGVQQYGTTASLINNTNVVTLSYTTSLPSRTFTFKYDIYIDFDLDVKANDVPFDVNNNTFKNFAKISWQNYSGITAKRSSNGSEEIDYAINANIYTGGNHVVSFYYNETFIGSIEFYIVSHLVVEGTIVINFTPPQDFNGHVEIPHDVTTIGAYAFAHCDSLQSITIPNTVTAIGASAFAGCTSLSKITIPGSVTTIGTEAFASCHANLVIDASDFFETAIPDGWSPLWNADNRTVLWKTGLINQGDTVIGFILPLNFNGHVDIPQGITVFGNGTSVFGQYASLVTSITIPNTVTTIGDGAFSGCSSLQSIIIPSSVKTIKGYAFAECYSLASVKFEEDSQLTSIGNNAFLNCTSLTDIIIPESVTNINGAFDGCSELRSITVPVSVMFTAPDFNGCDNLTIYLETAFWPFDWHPDWNPSNRPVIWSCFLFGYVDSFIKTASNVYNPNNYTISAPYREGYTFIGWDAGDRVYTAADVHNAPNRITRLKAYWAGSDSVTLLNAYNFDYEQIELSEGQSPERIGNQIVVFDNEKYFAYVYKDLEFFCGIESGDVLSDSGEYTIELYSKDTWAYLYTFSFELIDMPKFQMDYQILIPSAYQTGLSSNVTIIYANNTTQSIVITDTANFRFLISYDGINYFEGSAVDNHSELWVKLISKTNANYIESFHIHFMPEGFELPHTEIIDDLLFIDYEFFENIWDMYFIKILMFNDDLYSASYSNGDENFIECENGHSFDELGNYVVKLTYSEDESIVFYYEFSVWGISVI